MIKVLANVTSGLILSHGVQSFKYRENCQCACFWRDLAVIFLRTDEINIVCLFTYLAVGRLESVFCWFLLMCLRSTEDLKLLSLLITRDVCFHLNQWHRLGSDKPSSSNICSFRDRQHGNSRPVTVYQRCLGAHQCEEVSGTDSGCGHILLAP